MFFKYSSIFLLKYVLIFMITYRDKVAGCAKHYVGDGGTVNGINENNTIVSQHDLYSIHMPAYYDSIIKGVATVMASYSSLNGVKMHANRDMLTGFLKDTLKFKAFFQFNICTSYKKSWKSFLFLIILMDKCNISALLAEPFQGFVISDWQGIDKITYPPHANYTSSVQTSVLAGVDMVSYKS
jgi:beta-glucosidase-like glycosyl hydrolase